VIKNIFKKKLTCSFIFILILMSACTTTDKYNSTKVYKKPIFDEVMKESINYEGIDRNPVIFVHGFLGSKLVDITSGRNIWGNFNAYNALTNYSDLELQELSYPMVFGKPLKSIKDNAISTEVMSKADISVAGLDISINAYDTIIDLMQKGGYVLDEAPLPEGKNFYSLFIFHYDWRKDLVENSAELHKFILKKRSYLQNEYKKLYNVDNYDVKFDFVAHSMGGLLTRYYLRYGDQDISGNKLPEFDWRGAKYANKVVIIGTPNAGYLDTFYELLNGYKSTPISTPYPPALTGSWATYYEMLPLISTRSVVYEDDANGPSVNIFDPNIWIKYKWGLANPDQDKYLKIILPNINSQEERKKIAIDHLKKCLKRAKQFTDAMKIHKNPPKDVAFFLLFGNAVKTRRRAFINRETGNVNFSGYDSGDGIVCATSALFDERAGQKWSPKFKSPITWHTILPLMAAHMGLTESESLIDNIAYILSVSPK
jgi:hypothetical protein